MVTTGDLQEKEIPDIENSGESESEQDKIEKLKAENRLAASESEDKAENGHSEHKNGEAKQEDVSSNTSKEGENGTASSEPMAVDEENGAEEEGAPELEPQPSTSDKESAEQKATNGSAKANGDAGKKREGDNAVEQPPAKKVKTDSDDDDIQDVTPVTAKQETKKENAKKEPELTSAEALLNKLEDYVNDALDKKVNIDRKVLDALLGAINVQVQKEPLSVRKLILDKKLVLPNTISFPPSQIVELLIEHDPDYPLTKVVNKMFGVERPRLNDADKKERAQLKAHNPVPHMTKLLMDIGQDLVQEATYSDIVHARNLPETPKNIETYKQVAAQLKPVWETLRKKNEPYKLKLHQCQLCNFKTESQLVMDAHRSVTHFKNGKYQCAMCPEYDTNEQRLINHYLEAHLIIAEKEEKEPKFPCLICDEEFNFKGIRDTHLKTCKKEFARIRNIMAPKAEDHLHINRWLWEKPPIDPTILQQQQQAHQAAQARKNNLAQNTAAQAHLSQLRRQQQAHQGHSAPQNLFQQQLMQQSQRMRQNLNFNAILNNRNLANNNALISAMQQHLQKVRGNGNALTTQTGLAAAAMYQKLQQQSQKGNSSANAALAAAAAHLRTGGKNSPMNKSLGLSASPAAGSTLCEICDQSVHDKEKYLAHLQTVHKQMSGKGIADMSQGAPLACSRCRDRFWTYEGLERHLVMSHGLVTADLLQKAQKKEDGGRCKLCSKQYAFNMLQHLVADHQVKLCSAEIMYSCDVCSFKCTSYQTLEAHLTTNHPKGSAPAAAASGTDKSGDKDCITLDD